MYDNEFKTHKLKMKINGCISYCFETEHSLSLFRCKNVQFLITTGDGKFYSNGLDQSFLKMCTTEEFLVTLNLMNNTFTRLLTFPVLTVAALNGTNNILVQLL